MNTWRYHKVKKICFKMHVNVPLKLFEMTVNVFAHFSVNSRNDLSYKSNKLENILLLEAARTSIFVIQTAFKRSNWLLLFFTCSWTCKWSHYEKSQLSHLFNCRKTTFLNRSICLYVSGSNSEEISFNQLSAARYSVLVLSIRCTVCNVSAIARRWKVSSFYGYTQESLQWE